MLEVHKRCADDLDIRCAGARSGIRRGLKQMILFRIPQAPEEKDELVDRREVEQMLGMEN